VTAGRAAESSAQLVLRCESKWATLAAGGNSAAYLYNVNAIAPSITRVFVRDDNPYGSGTVALYLVNADGPATVDELEAVDDYLQPLKPLGSGRLYVLPAVPKVVQVTAVLTTNGDNPDALEDAADALDLLASGFEDRTLYAELVRTTLMGAAVAARELPGFSGVENVVMSLPAADVSIAGEEVLEFTTTLTEAP
jgi:hypothetical protein